MDNSIKTKTAWGGKRAGAGRPLTAGVPRKQRQLRATDEEWEIIRAFAKIVKTDRKRAVNMLETK